MVNTYKHQNITWYDLENPSSDEVRKLSEELNIEPLIANELLSPTLRPRVEYLKDYIYLILHFPVSYINDESADPQKIQEVDFVIGKNFIITTRYNSVDALMEFSKVFEVNSVLDKSNMSNHAGYIFFYMIQNLYKSLQNRLEAVKDVLFEIENKIFQGQEKQMVFELSKINRLLLSYKESVLHHKEILESFERAAQDFYGRDFDRNLHAITGEYTKVQDSLNSSKEFLNELRETNDSLLSTKQNEIMKNLTVVTFTVLPLSLIAALFGMNTVATPIVGQEGDFILVILLMIVVTTAISLYFKYKNWL